MAKQAKVILTINRVKSDISENNEIAKWLRRQADWFLIHASQKKLGKRVTLRYRGRTEMFEARGKTPDKESGS